MTVDELMKYLEAVHSEAEIRVGIKLGNDHRLAGPVYGLAYRQSRNRPLFTLRRELWILATEPWVPMTFNAWAPESKLKP